MDKDVLSIMRVIPNSTSFVINIKDEGVKLITIKDMKSNQWSLHTLFKAINFSRITKDSLHVKVTQSHLTIAAGWYEYDDKVRGKTYSGVKLMKVAIAEI